MMLKRSLFLSTCTVMALGNSLFANDDLKARLDAMEGCSR